MRLAKIVLSVARCRHGAARARRDGSDQRCPQGTKAAGYADLIGAAVDLTKGMAPFDAPALTAAQLEIKKINAAGRSRRATRS